MRMEMTFGMIDFRMIKAIGRRLMKAHRVREGNSEHAVVSGSYAMQNIAQRSDFFGRELIHASEMSATANQNFERPGRPEWHEGNESVVLANHAHVLALLQCNVIAKKASIVRI